MAKPATPFLGPPATCASFPVMVVAWKLASSVRKHLVAALLHSAGRSIIHSAEARLQVAQAAVWVADLPVVRSEMVSTNLPPV